MIAPAENTEKLNFSRSIVDKSKFELLEDNQELGDERKEDLRRNGVTHVYFCEAIGEFIAKFTQNDTEYFVYGPRDRVFQDWRYCY